MPTSTYDASLAVPDSEVARLLLGHDIQAVTRNRLRKKGQWPRSFFVGSRAYVLRRDIDEFIARRQTESEAEREKLREKTRAAANKRWHPHDGA